MRVLRLDAPHETQGKLLPSLRSAAVGGLEVPCLRQRGGCRLDVLPVVRPRDGVRVKRHAVAVIAGDGIGPEGIAAAMPVINAAPKKHGCALDRGQLPYSADHYPKTK